ncbi:MBL fold metallo-hydrolase [Chitinibacter bivalviorum]|uniref:MBL fold metallo-hydrolase n=1 Tax=Chitinibacter bivalviorum TaxID=2739434 RepID=A0A7H9BGW2_9NEIS|nr:MBL fold metallo-hydrolase [Chitinibacter bivalviorum]QLG87835.1 MBL fold metallo-hydrolase [Chitinibacter bivalviorum]
MTVANTQQQPQVEAFYDPATFTISYLVYDKLGGHAAIIDPVLDYDAKSARTSTGNAQKIVDRIRAMQLTLDWILETHAHADHLSAAAWLQQQLGGKIAIGKGIEQVQKIFKPIFGMENEFATDGRQFDHLVVDNEEWGIGQMTAKALMVPGHTPADVAYLIGDALFLGDTLFMPDVGSARCDFPGGDAGRLYDSVQRLYQLPDETRAFACHDYQPANRANPAWEASIAEHKAHNIHLSAATSRDDFVKMREARDATLAMPVLIMPSIQVNVRAGHLPPAEADGRQYLKLPLNTL